MPTQLKEAIPPANRDYYSFAQRATRLIDLRMDEKGQLVATKRIPDPASNVWQSDGSALSFSATAGNPLKWTVNVGSGQWSLVAVQPEDWPVSYEATHTIALGLLAPFAGFGQELPMGNENAMAELSTTLSCSLTSDGLLTYSAYGRHQMGGVFVDNAQPTTAVTIDIKSMRAPTMATGIAHMVVRLTDIPPLVSGGNPLRNTATVSINGGAAFGYPV